MAQVTVKINGYAYNLVCEDGQEPHLLAMAEQVEGRIESIKALGNQSGEARLLVLAALLMADELHDLKAEMAHSATGQSTAGQSASGQATTGQPGRAAAKGGKPDRDMARSLAKMATRAEDIAANLERP